MKTDTLFYRLFLQRPELIFDLATDLPRPNTSSYRFKSVEVKQAAFRIDGVFIPADDQLEYPLIFAEVQYQKDPKIYARLVGELALYLYQKAPRHNWRAVVIFPDETSDPGESEHYREFFSSGRIQRVYLNQLPEHAQGLGVQLIQLIEVDETCVTEQLKHIKRAIIASPPDNQRDWLELLETILVYKLPRISRDEVKEMLSDILNVELKQTRFYQDVFTEGLVEGRQEGIQAGRQEGIQAGRQEGIQVGESTLLERQIIRRFGSINLTTRERLKNATSEQLEHWADNILEATSLEEVFKGSR